MLFLNDLNLEHQNSHIQIDSLGAASNTLYSFEIKNYEGDYIIKNGNWHLLSGKEIKNPLLQKDRAESFLRQSLQKIGLNLQIKSYLIFINPEFHLYQAPVDPSIIYPPQLPRFLQNFKSSPLSINSVAKQILTLDLKENPYSQIPEYGYHALKKGIYCLICGEFYSKLVRTNFICCSCGAEENHENAVLRNVTELKTLFPEARVTTSLVHDWCGIVKDKRTIRKILLRNYLKAGNLKSTHFTE